MKRFYTLFTLLLLLPMYFVAACASGVPPAAVIAQWLPAIFSALGTAESAINVIGAWANRFQNVPAVAAQLPQLNALLQSAREDFDRARELANKGAEFEQDAKQFYQQGAQTLKQAVALISELGLFRDEKLVRPPEAAPRDGCPRSSVPEELRIDLPPDQV